MHTELLLCIGCKHCKKWFSRANGWAYYCDSKECIYKRKDDEIDQ